MERLTFLAGNRVRIKTDSVDKLAKKLAEYEDLEEQGLLLRLPCKVGDTLYRINKGAKEPVIKMRVLQVHFKQLHKNRTIIRIDAIKCTSVK